MSSSFGHFTVLCCRTEVLLASVFGDFASKISEREFGRSRLPIDGAVIDGEAIVLRPDNTSDFEALKSRHGQAEAILVAYDIMEVDGQDVRPEPLGDRKKRLTKLLSRKTKAMRDGIQLSEAITGDGDAIF